MSERISIKGKGAELFFGDDDAREAAQAAPEVRATPPAPGPASPPATQPPGQQATTPPGAQGGSRTLPTNDLDDGIRRRLRGLLSEEHPLHYSYRFTREEIDALRDVVYELEAKRGVNATRNDVVRLGLNWVIDDYRMRGKDSLLVQVLKEERWDRGR